MSRLIKVYKSWGETDLCFAVIDSEDYELVMEFGNRYGGWDARRTKEKYTAYAVVCDENQRVITSMHRIILGLTGRYPIVDHVDGNGLNNRKSNLRKASYSQNQQNSKKPNRGNGNKYKGAFRKGGSKYYSSIILNGKSYKLGVHETEIEAAQAYDRKAIELFGEFARLNFPKE